MNIVRNKSKSFYIEEDVLQEKIFNFLSISTIVILSCIIIVTAALIFDIIIKMNNPTENITYQVVPNTVVEEKPIMLTVEM